ncbi:hypothetical protein D3C87_1400220 [compost metagenome]
MPFRPLQQAFIDHHRTGHGRIESSAEQVEEDFILRAVAHHFGTGRGKFFGDVAIEVGRALHPDPLAFELGRYLADAAALLEHQARRDAVIAIAEVDRFQPFRGHGHRRNHRIDFLHLERGNQPVELLFLPHALDFHLGAQCLADVVVEADDGVIRGFRSERRVSRFDAQAQRLLRRVQVGAERQQRDQANLQ